MSSDSSSDASPRSGHKRLSTIQSSSPNPPPRCSQCKSRPEDPRNLAVCIDGTSNQFGQNNTNVVKLFAKIDLENKLPEQCAYYSSGIGAGPESLHLFDRLRRAVSDKFDMAIAWNLEEIVMDAYTWLAQTYKPGDQLYLFGFSRGAYQVRVLSAMIYEVGLIRTPTKKQIGMAYNRYQAIRSGRAKARQDANEFKNTFSWKDLKVHFVGVWDTVSSVGLIKGDVFLSSSASGEHTCHFRHALALDESRVKFLPEYFHEMNSLMDGKYRHSVPSITVEPARNSVEQPQPTLSEGTLDVKEVWFAGCHSDVGGKGKPGTSHQAGNASLLWMRREAAANGLILKPTDIVWIPDDLDSGTSNSMSLVWKIIEYLPVMHQVSFSGAGGHARRRHLLQPRRIIPGQKVHASILYGYEYEPRATLGKGFDIPITHAELEDAELSNHFWETGLFDNSAAESLLSYLKDEQGIARIHLDRLLFMLRFEEGRQYVGNVSGWQQKFMDVLDDPNSPSLVKLVTLIAYYEVSFDHHGHPISSFKEPSRDVFENARVFLLEILDSEIHQDRPRVVPLLKPLAKHKILKDLILTDDVLDTLVSLLDKTIEKKKPGEYFAQAMHGLTYLLQCGEDTQKFLIDKLADKSPNPNVSRLSRILEFDEPRTLAPALRMLLTLARISKADYVCEKVKSRVTELTKSKNRLIGLLAVEISLALYNPEDEVQLDFHNAHVRANLASALIRLKPSESNLSHHVDPRRQIFHRVFGFGAKKLDKPQKMLIKKLQGAIQRDDVRERTSATITILKLCETEAIRTYLREINMLNIFINQLRGKKSALLAAFALAICLQHSDTKAPILENNLLPKYIVDMIRLDYFDDAVGRVEGFEIFEEFLRHDELREKIKSYCETSNGNETEGDIADVLNTKLGRGDKRETRTSLICLDIIRSSERDGTWTNEIIRKLVNNSLNYLRKQTWEDQKAGVTILSALAHTEDGETVIQEDLVTIIEMLLPQDRRSIRDSLREPVLASEGRTQPQQNGSVRSTNYQLLTPLDAPRKPSSWMMGPACALRILARNRTLRDRIRKARQYADLKDLFQSGVLVGVKDTLAVHINTPNRNDITFTLEKMIKVVDGELCEEGLMSVRDTMLPHIKHWDRLFTTVQHRTMEGVVIFPVLLGVSAIALVSGAVIMTMHVSEQACVRTWGWMRKGTQNTRHAWHVLREKLQSAPGASAAPVVRPRMPVVTTIERRGSRREQQLRRAMSDGFLLDRSF